MNVTNTAGVTPLQIACSKGAYDCAKVLIGAKADPTIVKGGDPPLFGAVICDNSALVRILLEAGADVGQPNAYVLHLAGEVCVMCVDACTLGMCTCAYVCVGS